MCVIMVWRHLKINISGEAFPAGLETEASSSWGYFPAPPTPGLEKEREAEVPHESLRELLHKVVNFDPIISHTPRPAK